MANIPEEALRRVEEVKEKRLTKLDLSWCGLTTESLGEILRSYSELRHLEELNISANWIRTLPKELTALNKLTSLDVSVNDLGSLPDWMSEFKQLTSLNVYNNKIKTISPKNLPLENLRYLSLDGNPIEEPPLEVVEKGVDAIREYFRQLEDEGLDHLYEAKLLILGEGGAGKTSLARKIKNRNSPLPKKDDSTRGIEVIKWQFPCHDGNTFTANIWDFGGQIIYHQTHQFFLTKRSLYVLVADTRKENTDFYYWLNVVELLSDNSPLLIVKNEIDNRLCNINESALRGQFDNLKETLATNLADLRGYDAMMEKIKHFIATLPHIGSPLPKTWVRVREALEKDARNYISLDEYLNICQQNGFKRKEDKLQLGGYLHDLGVCLHFQDDPLLNKTVILKPKWGTDAVYKALDDRTVVANHGRFNKADMARIWHEEEYADMRDELLHLMMKFKLCYKIPNSEDYIAPQLLSDNQPTYDRDEKDNLFLRYKYDFMPKGILTQFIVVMHKLIKDQSLVWKSGVILEQEKTQAEVIEYYNKNEIRIRVVGPHKKRLMDIVSYELDEIHASYKCLKYKKLIPCNCDKCKDSQEPHFYSFDTLLKFWEDRRDIQCQNSYEMINVRGLLDDAIANKINRAKLMEAMINREGKQEIVELPEERKRGDVYIFHGEFGSVGLQKTDKGNITMSNNQQVAETAVIQQSNEGDNKMTQKKQNTKPIRSPWASGSFYLVAAVILLVVLGVLGNKVPLAALPIVLIAGCILVPVVGALQLKQDARLSDKSFVELMKITVGQLPLIGNFFNPAQKQIEPKKD